MVDYSYKIFDDMHYARGKYSMFVNALLFRLFLDALCDSDSLPLKSMKPNRWKS